MSQHLFLHTGTNDFIIKGELIRENDKTYSSNRSFKDTVFRKLFDDENNLLQLYNALEDSDTTKPGTVQINTLEGVIFNRVRNDLSFSIDDWYLSIVEHQSTRTENAPLRMFIYLARIYEQILEMTKAYGITQYKIPEPYLYMLYNGIDDFPQEKLIHFSEAFMGKRELHAVELTVKVINININKGHPILKKCKVLREYSLFIERIREKQRGKKLNRDLAIKEAIRECIDENILTDFLKKHGNEVNNMLFDEITYEDILQVRVNEAVEQGIANFILDYHEEGFSRERILEKLVTRFALNEGDAVKYYDKYVH